MSYPCYATLIQYGSEGNQVWDQDGEFHPEFIQPDGRTVSTQFAHLYREQMAPGAKVGDRARLVLRDDGKVYAELMEKEEE